MRLSSLEYTSLSLTRTRSLSSELCAHPAQLLVVALGFDAARGDPVGGFRLSPEGLARCVGALTAGLAGGKAVLCLEGGYGPEAPPCAEACLRVLLANEARAAATAAGARTAEATAAAAMAAGAGVGAPSCDVKPGAIAAVAEMMRCHIDFFPAWAEALISAGSGSSSY